MDRPAQHSGDQDLTAKARIRNAALELYAANGEDRTPMRAVAAAAGVTVGLVVHHYGSKDGLREAVEQIVVERFASALASAPTDGAGEEIARVRNEAVSEMLVRNPEVVNYLRRALLEPGGQRGQLLERLTELTHREVVAMRETGAASRGRADSVQVVDVIINQMGRLFLQPLVDAVWTHLGTFTHTEGRSKPELGVSVSGEELSIVPTGQPPDSSFTFTEHLYKHHAGGYCSCCVRGHISDLGVIDTSGVTMATLGGALALNARRHPDKTALIFGESTYSYEQLAARINQYAHALASLGVGKGDRVALLSPNSDAYILGLYGAFRLGAIAVPLNPRVPARELRYLLEDSGATVLLYSEGLAVVVAGLDELDPLPSAPQSLVLDEPAAQGIARLADTMPTTAPEVEVIEDDDCIILYTSGTTGRPKGAVFDHHRMLWVGNSVSALGMNIFDRNLHVAPMYHCAELVLFVMSGFSLGTTHVVLPAFEPKAVLDALEKHRITVFLGVPTMYQMLLQHPELGTRDLSAWRLGFFGAAPMPPSAATSLLATLPHVQFFQLCGQTEGGPTGIFLTPDEVRARPDATGRASITNAETRIVDDEGNDTAVGEPGEIIYRGETIMKGYWNKPEATADALRDGWLHSGDVAVRDADGFITIVDRMKDMIITGGRNVYSVEVEQALAGHPDVADVAVVGRPDEMFGESLIAVVTPVEGREVTLESLREYGSQFIAGYKLPRELITRPIPRNPSGKTGSPETVRCVFTVRELNVYDVCSQLENSTCTFEGVDVPRTFLARSIGYAAAALLVATATATAGAPAVAEPADAPVENGGLLRSVKTDLLAGAIPTGVKATSVTYRSSDTRGKPVATTGIVMVPASKWTGRGPRPLVTYAVGTHGSDPSCRPSQLLTRGLTTDRSGVPMIELQLLDVASLLTRGFAVTMTDFQGTEAPGRLPYLQPIPQAHAVLDAARAAISVGAVDRRAPVGIWGYSQGGGAAAAAAEQAKSYAPELNIRGSVVGAPPTNPARTMMFNEGKLSAGVIGYFVNGVRAEYPQLAPKIDAKLNSQGRDFLRKTAGECLVGSVVGHYFRSTKGMTVSGRPLIEELASDPEINSVFQSFVMGRTAPSHPVLLMQNVNDDVVPADDANATADAWKRGGTNVARANINTPSLPPIGAPGHAVGLVTGNIAVNWLAGRLTQ